MSVVSKVLFGSLGVCLLAAGCVRNQARRSKHLSAARILPRPAPFPTVGIASRRRQRPRVNHCRKILSATRNSTVLPNCRNQDFIWQT